MGWLTLTQIAAVSVRVRPACFAVVGVIVTKILLRRYPVPALVLPVSFGFVALTILLYRHDIGSLRNRSRHQRRPSSRILPPWLNIIWWLNSAGS